MYDPLLEYSAHVRVIPAKGPVNSYIGALFQREILEMQEYGPYVRIRTLCMQEYAPYARPGTPRVQEYCPDVRAAVRTCKNNAPMYDSAASARWDTGSMYGPASASGGILLQCATRRFAHAGIPLLYTSCRLCAGNRRGSHSRLEAISCQGIVRGSRVLLGRSPVEAISCQEVALGGHICRPASFAAEYGL